MRPKICRDNGVKIPTSDCSTCEILEQKVDALTEELENKQDVLTAGDHIVIEDNVISADLDDYFDKTEVNTLINGVNGISFEVVSVLPEEGDRRVIYLVPDGSNYIQYVYTDDGWENIGSTASSASDSRLATPNVTELEAGFNTTYDTFNLNWINSNGDAVSFHSINDSGNPVLSYLPNNDWSQEQTVGRIAFLSDITKQIQPTVYSYSGTASTLSGSTWYGPVMQIAAFTAFDNCTFIGMLTVTFDANATGDRQIGATLNSGTAIGAGTKVRAASSGVTVLSIPIMTRMTTSEHIRAEAWQNSGSTIGITVQMKGIFIED